MGRGPSIAARKGAEDARRGKLFTKFIREITVAARAGGGDPKTNPRLRLVLDKALAANMTKDTAERAIKRGTGEGGDAHFEEIRYEGYGPGGVALMVDCMTDNPTRTVADVRHAFTKNGGNMGNPGAVSYLFSHVGQIFLEANADGFEDRVMEIALDAGADDVVSEAGFIEIITTPDALTAVKDALTKAGLTLVQADVTMRPATMVNPGEHAIAVQKIIDMLDDLDDVQKVYSNADLEHA